MMMLFGFAILLALVTQAATADNFLCAPNETAIPQADGFGANCRMMSAANCKKTSTGAGYHQYGRIRCPLTCMKLMKMVKFDTGTKLWVKDTVDPKDWLKPFAATDTGFCANLKAGEGLCLTDCTTGYVCAKTCELKVAATNEPAPAGGKTDGGKTDGDKTDGGKTDGGKTDGGKTDGGKTDGGKTDGDKTDGGKTDGGKTDGGKTDGGKTDGDKTDGGKTDAVKTAAKS